MSPLECRKDIVKWGGELKRMILSEKHGVNEILYQLFKAAVVRGGNSRLVTWTRVVKTHVFFQ